MTSRRAAGLDPLLGDAEHGSLYQVVCVLSSDEAFTRRGLARAFDVPLLSHPILPFCAARHTDAKNRVGRHLYDEETARLLSPFAPDLVLLSGYRWLVTHPVLDAFPERVLNVAPADFLRADAAGQPLFAGTGAVKRALLAGEKELRATVHLVTSGVAGPALLRSWPFPVPEGAAEAVGTKESKRIDAHALALREWMLRTAWGPLLRQSIRLLATHPVRLTNGAFRLGDERGPWELTRWGRIVVEADRYATLNAYRPMPADESPEGAS